MLGVLTLAFFGQEWLSRSERAVRWFRMAFLLTTLFFLGWYANAQLSVVNIMALANSVAHDFSWQAFLLDPLTFILWFSVAAALIFWGRGAFCGWLCPFGALQELTNNVAKALRMPQIQVPWLVHERLWPVKYIIFLVLFGVSLASMELAEKLAEVEPFKTAIILKFHRAWPFVTFAAGPAGHRAVRRTLLLPLSVPAGRGAGHSRPAAHVRLAETLQGMRQPVPDLRQ